MTNVIATLFLLSLAIGYYLTNGAHTVFLIIYAIFGVVGLLCVYDMARYEQRSSSEIAAARLRYDKLRRRALEDPVRRKDVKTLELEEANPIDE